MDSVSMNSGFMSRNTKKRSIRRDGRGGQGKRSISLAIQNETLINKIQEQLVEFKQSVNNDIQRIDASAETSNADIEARLTEISDHLAKNTMLDLSRQMAEMRKM